MVSHIFHCKDQCLSQVQKKVEVNPGNTFVSSVHSPFSTAGKSLLISLLSQIIPEPRGQCG